MNPQAIIGQTLTVGSYNVFVKEKIGEGGYAFVYRVVDTHGKEYALKYVNCLNRERYNQFKQEADFISKVPQSEYIIRLYDSSLNPQNFTAFFLFEYCPLTAMDILTKRNMTTEEIYIFFHAICAATALLHSQEVPILHRDLKPENLLVSTDGIPKLCDFGSATTTIYTLQDQKELSIAGEDIEKNTTQNYRSPEMVDLYKRMPIDKPSDVWALGCTLYKLALRNDIYEPNDRLPILQGRLNFPPNLDKNICNLIRMCIIVDPKKRATAARLAEIALSLRGDAMKIALPPRNADVSISISPSGNRSHADDNQLGWNVIKDKVKNFFVKDGVEDWATKATTIDNDPPDSKCVRRIIMGYFRRTSDDYLNIVNFLLEKRQWNSDIRIATKVIYILMLMTQNSKDVRPLVNISSKIDHMIKTFSRGQHNMKHGVLLNNLGLILRRKLGFHSANPFVEGNMFSSQKTDKLSDELMKYSTSLASCTEQLIKICQETSDFAIIVMSQPAVEECVCSIRLLSAINPSGYDSLSGRFSKVFDICKKIQYLSSSVDYPTDMNNPGKPYSKFSL